MESKTKPIYFDANATTLMPKTVITTMLKWVNRGNPSSEYSSAKACKALIGTLKDFIAKQCQFSLDDFAVIITSGASESNAHILTSMARAYARKTRRQPHIITSSVEHKSVLNCCAQLEADKVAQITYLPVEKEGPLLGTVLPENVYKAIQSNTCLISIMAANNETGILNNIAHIGKIAHSQERSIPFHTDAVQLFPRTPIIPDLMNVDAFSISFHKLHGPPGTGLLVVRKSIMEAYGFTAMIAGTQNDGLRGGTESIHNIAASFAAMKYTYENRHKKTADVGILRETIKELLARLFPCYYLDDFSKASSDIKKAKSSDSPVIFWIAPKNSKNVLANTLLLSVYRPLFCNKAARAAMEYRGIMISTGSACNSASDAPSGVVAAMQVPKILMDGVLRISLDDTATIEEVKEFIRQFVAVIKSDECLRKQ